jgi:hypothetical protein
MVRIEKGTTSRSERGMYTCSVVEQHGNGSQMYKTHRPISSPTSSVSASDSEL